MGCFSPLTGYASRVVNPATGKRSTVWNAREGLLSMRRVMPCGRCMPCRLERSRQMAVRCMHEASLHDRNCFLTLTYAPEHIPANGSIDPRAGPLFMMRLRQRFGAGVRSYGCAEYGEKGGRPHYHLCLFNFDFDDKFEPRRTKSGELIYRSKVLEELWPFGHASVGALTFESAAYVARYVTKKLSGPMSKVYEAGVSPTGEILYRLPERAICVSKRPAIGRDWLEKYSSDVYPSDDVIVRGKRMRPPKYYDRVFSVANPETFAKVRSSRSSAVAELQFSLVKGFVRVDLEARKPHWFTRMRHFYLTRFKANYRSFENDNEGV